MLYFTNRQQFSMHCTLIDHRNVAKMFKTQAEPRAAGEWCHCKVWNILTSFLRSITEQPWKIVVDLLFTITLTILKSISVARERERKKETKNKLCHHHVISVVCTLIEHSSRQISGR